MQQLVGVRRRKKNINKKLKMIWREGCIILSIILLAILKFPQRVHADHNGSDDPLDWLRESIPGEPGVDYPIFAEVESTAFSCKDRVFGGK